MKQKFTLTLLFILSAFATLAQRPNRTMLSLRLSDQSVIAVNLDGKYISRGTTSLTLDGIRPGLHRVEVYSEASYRRRPVRIYTGTLRLAPGTVNIGVVDVYNRGLRLRTRPMDDAEYKDEDYRQRDGRNDYPEDGRNRDEDRDWRDNRGNNDDVYGRDNFDNRPNDNTGNAEGYGSFPRGRGNAVHGTGSGFSQRDMDDLRTRVQGRITDSDKEQLMKTAIQARTVGTDQVRQMLSWLSFDDTRLDFAKWAYTYVSDRQNYWKLEDAFSFESSKDEFNKSIRSRR